MSKYKVELISMNDKDKLMEKYEDRFPYEERADIYGCCVKLLTDAKYVKERWEENFYPMSAHVRSHGRIVVTEENNEKQRVFYEPLSKTAFLINVDYYGWIKSIALSVASDILEDSHYINSVHGACVDIDGQGVCLIAPSGTGKTTHTYGLLRLKNVRVISDDWFFVRFMADQAVAFSSEKNSYIQADIANTWDEYKKLADKAEFDSKGRAVVNIRWIAGKGKMLPMTTLKRAILLKRDPEDQTMVRKLLPEEATRYVETVDFCNPHMLVKTERKMELRKQFFKEFFVPLETYVVNTTAPVLDTHKAIKEEILGIWLLNEWWIWRKLVHVKDFLGHKSLNSTEVYINIERTMFESACDEFTVKVTEKPEEIKALLITGFEYVCEKDNLAFLRKRK